MIDNKFNVKKALQVLYYLQTNAKNTTEASKYLYLLKLFFLSDRFHIRNFAIPIFETRYVARRYGPLSTEIDAMLVDVNFGFGYLKLSDDDKKVIENNIKRSGYDCEISPQGDNLLSISVKDSLNFAIENFSKLGRFELSNITHDYPEWYKTKDDEIMNYLDFFDDPNFEQTQYLKIFFKNDPYEMSKEELNFNKNQFTMFAGVANANN